MTKLRHPMTFADAVTRIAGRITWAGAAEACGKAERTVRAWSDPDMGRAPDIDDCLALDRAYIEAGGREAPLYALYGAKLDRGAAGPAATADLCRATSAFAKEAGEAIAASVAACSPGALAQNGDIALKELAEAREKIADLEHMLSSRPTLLKAV